MEILPFMTLVIITEKLTNNFVHVYYTVHYYALIHVYMYTEKRYEMRFNKIMYSSHNFRPLKRTSDIRQHLLKILLIYMYVLEYSQSSF